MPEVMNLHRPIQRIALDDSPDSPVFTLDLTDKGMSDKAVIISGCCQVYLETAKQMKTVGLTDEVAHDMAYTYRIIIDTMLGEGSFDVITDWLSDGNDVEPEQMIAIYSPLVEYLLGEYDSVLTANKNLAAQRYLNDAIDPL